MGSGPTMLRLARGGTSALDLDTEAGRAFLQERLAFYNKRCFLPGVGPWSEEEARAWWDRWRARCPSPGGNP